MLGWVHHQLVIRVIVIVLYRDECDGCHNSFGQIMANQSVLPNEMVGMGMII